MIACSVPELLRALWLEHATLANYVPADAFYCEDFAEREHAHWCIVKHLDGALSRKHSSGQSEIHEFQLRIYSLESNVRHICQRIVRHEVLHQLNKKVTEDGSICNPRWSWSKSRTNTGAYLATISITMQLAN